MLLVRRRTPNIPPKPATQSATTAPVRRLALAGSASDMHAQRQRAKAEIDKHLKLISDAHRQIDDAQLVSDNSHRVIEAQLRLVNMTEHSDGVYKAAMVEVYSRQSRTIDPKKFKVHVADSVFWGSIKVSVENAKAHLTEKELAAISDVKAGKSTGVQLKVDKLEKR